MIEYKQGDGLAEEVDARVYTVNLREGYSMVEIRTPREVLSDE